MQLIKIGDQIVNLDNATDINLNAIGINYGSGENGGDRRERCVRIEFNVPQSSLGYDSVLEAYSVEFFGEDAEFLRRYLADKAVDVKTYQPAFTGVLND